MKRKTRAKKPVVVEPPKDEFKALALTNAVALTFPEVNSLFGRAFAGGYLECAWDGNTAMAMAKWIESPNVGVWLGMHNGEPKGLLVVLLPDSPLIPLPLVYTIYNEGHPEVAKAMARAGIEYLRAHGYSAFMGGNRLTENDELYTRLMSHAGVGSRMGTLFKFEMPKD